MAPPNRSGQHGRIYATLALAGLSALAAASGLLRAIFAPSSPGWIASLLSYAGIAGIAIVLLLLSSTWRPPATGDASGGSGAS